MWFGGVYGGGVCWNNGVLEWNLLFDRKAIMQIFEFPSRKQYFQAKNMLLSL